MSELARLNPFIASLMSRLGVGTRALEVEVVQPAETEAVLPPVMLDGQLDRATATDEHSALRDHIEAALATVAVHAPLLRFHLRHVLVGNDGFAGRVYGQRYSKNLVRDALTKRILSVGRLRFCHNYVTWRYFGHWLTDGLPMCLIDEAAGGVWLPHPSSWRHCDGYLASLALEPVMAPLVYAEELVFYQDFGQGSQKRMRYQRIRSELRGLFGNGVGADHVYISRGNTGVARLIANEAEVIDKLRLRNWSILDIATASMEEVQRCVCAARVVVSIDGSHLDHAHLSLGSSGVMIILVPGDRFSMRQLGVCRAHGVIPAVLVLNGSGTTGYHLDLEELHSTLDLALDRAERRLT